MPENTSDTQQHQQSPLSKEVADLAERIKEAPEHELRGLIAAGFAKIAEAL